MPTRDSISSAKMAASSKPRAGRIWGASSTIWNKRTLRRWHGKRWSGSGHFYGIEEQIRGHPSNERREVRQAQAHPHVRGVAGGKVTPPIPIRPVSVSPLLYLRWPDDTRHQDGVCIQIPANRHLVLKIL
jgi:hypothetical protein